MKKPDAVNASMRFPGFLGNEPLKQQLSQLLREDRIPQAIVLEGEAGCGKRTLARLIAAALCCRAAGERPCGHCAECRKSLGEGHPDIITVSGGDSPRSFKIDTVREMRADVNIRPNEAERKIYILENAHNMGEPAQNALLKILEEPPEYAVFLLTCESAGQLLPTVLSRAAVLRVNTLDEETAIAAALPLCPSAGEDELRRAARAFGGNVGRMVEALSGGLLTRAGTVANEMLASLPKKEETALLCAAAPLLRDKDLCRAALGLLGSSLRDGIAGRGALPGLNPGELVRLWQITRECTAAMDGYANQALLVTVFCARMRRCIGR